MPALPCCMVALQAELIGKQTAVRFGIHKKLN